MRARTSQPRSIGHLIGSVLLLLGMAAMHHLVVSGCAAAVVDHASLAHASHATADVVENPHLEVSDTAHGTHEEGETSGTGGPVDHSGAALCLAIIVGAWLLTPLLRFRRVAQASRWALREPATVGACPPRPPDLHLLSVCRT